MYKVEKAIDEIQRLSTDAKMHLSHIFRNCLQNVIGETEMGLLSHNALTLRIHLVEVRKAAECLHDEIKRLKI